VPAARRPRPTEEEASVIRTSHRAAVLATVMLTILATLALAPGVSATFPDRNGLIAFQADIGNSTQIFTMRPNGHDLRQITHVDGTAEAPDWSPDGQRLTFAYNECSVAFIDADGTNLQVIPPAAGDGTPGVDVCDGDSSFTPDGERVVYGHYNAVLDQEDIRSMRLDGTDRQIITNAGGPDPNVSPDGQKISFKGPPDGALFVANIDGSGIVQVSPSISVSYKHDWAPDGQHLVVSDNSEPGPDEAANVVTVRPDGSDWTYLTHYPAGFRAYAGGYSPDGQWIVFRLVGPGVVPTMYRIRPDGSDLHALFTSSTLITRNIDWGPAAQR
jgi:Tol biopolymer transport system component